MQQRAVQRTIDNNTSDAHARQSAPHENRLTFRPLLDEDDDDDSETLESVSHFDGFELDDDDDEEDEEDEVVSWWLRCLPVSAVTTWPTIRGSTRSTTSTRRPAWNVRLSSADTSKNPEFEVEDSFAQTQASRASRTKSIISTEAQEKKPQMLRRFSSKTKAGRTKPTAIAVRASTARRCASPLAQCANQQTARAQATKSTSY